MKENQTFQRYEFKYLINKKISDEIIIQVNNFMQIDKYAIINSQKNYFVRSIYFDDDFNTNFYEKVDGYKIRKKFRIRYYNKDYKKSSIYLEAKGRNLDRTFKQRTRLDYEDIIILNQKKNISDLNLKYPNNNIINSFVFEYYRKKLKPKIILDYLRTPFVNSYGLYFRLTFDKNINCTKINKFINSNFVEQNILCKAGYTILEVKFERSIPMWFHKIIQSYELNRISISKFVLGMRYSRQGVETSD